MLEFWATWCAPCLQAVPHLNELQAKFKNQKNLLFISLTYETPEKVKRTLDKIKFQTIVATDETNQTQKNFNVIGVPYTILIDNQGFIRWIGVPFMLNEKMIELLLKGDNGDNINANMELTPELKKLKEFQSIQQNENKQSIAVSKTFWELVKDKNNLFYFSLYQSEGLSSISTNAFGTGKYFSENDRLNNILANILNVSVEQIVLPDSLQNKKFSIIYKNANALPEEKHKQICKKLLLESLNLNENLEKRDFPAYRLKVVNAKKLPISLEKDKEKETSHNGSNTTHLVFGNCEIDIVVKMLTNEYKALFEADASLLNQKYDFILHRKSLELLQKDLKSYGIELEKTTQKLDFYIYR